MLGEALPRAESLDRSWLSLAVIGLLGGFFSGLLGIGGGTVMVPLLVLIGGLSQRASHATSLAAMIVIAAAAMLIYCSAGKVDLLAAAGLLVGSMVGARVGADLLSKSSERTLKAAFASFLLLAAILLALDP